MATERYFLIFSMYALFWLYPLATACRITFGNKPFIDHKCAPYASIGPPVYYYGVRFPQCEWHCLKVKHCRYLNYNGSSGQCELGFAQCVSLSPAHGFLVNAYGPNRNTCLHWGSGQQTGLAPVEDGDSQVARVVIGTALVLGRFIKGMGRIYGNHEGTYVGVPYNETLGHQLLMADPACTLPWMQYTPHMEIPSGAVIGGHLADGSPTYVAKLQLTRGGITYTACGYYNPKTGKAYAEAWGIQTSTDMLILILLW